MPAPLTVVVPDLFDHSGGIARISQALILASTRWATERGRDLIVMVLNDAGGLRDTEVCPPIVDYRAYSGHRWRLASDLLSLALRRRHLPMVIGHVNLAPLALATLARGGGYAIVAHGLDVWLPASPIRALALRRARTVWPVSHYTAEVLHSRGLPRASLSVIMNCLDPRRTLAPIRAPPDERQPPRFLTVSRLHYADRDKGVDKTIEAFALARPRLPPGTTLEIVGEGDDRDRLTRLAHALGVASVVHFRGRVSDQEVDVLLESARAFVLPSRLEGFGLVFVEAMARGRAVIAARATATPEVVCDGVSGLLVGFGDRGALAEAIVRVGTDHAFATAMGVHGRARVEEHFLFARYAREVGHALDALTRRPTGQTR